MRMIKSILACTAMILVAATGALQLATAGEADPQRPSDSDLMAFKVYHHTVTKRLLRNRQGEPINCCIPPNCPLKVRTLS